MGGRRELNFKFFLFSDLYYYIFCYDKDLLHNSIIKHFWILPFAKVFPLENELFFLFAKVFFREICPKNRHSRTFLSNISRFFRHAKVSARESITICFHVTSKTTVIDMWFNLCSLPYHHPFGYFLIHIYSFIYK